MVGVRGTIEKVVPLISLEPPTVPEFIRIKSFTCLVLKTFLMMQVKAILFRRKRYSNPDPKPKPEPVLKAVIRVIIKLCTFLF